MSLSYLVDWAWSFPHVNIDEEEGMKFDTGVDKKWHRDRLENEENRWAVAKSYWI